MYITKRLTWTKKTKLTCFRIETIQTTILCSNPYYTLIIFTKFPYPHSMKAIGIMTRIIFFKITILLGQIINSSKIRTNPDSSFFIFT